MTLRVAQKKQQIFGDFTTGSTKKQQIFNIYKIFKIIFYIYF